MNASGLSRAGAAIAGYISDCCIERANACCNETRKFVSMSGRVVARLDHAPAEVILLDLRLPGSGMLSEIRDRSGKLLLALSEEITMLDDLDLTGATLDRIEADGLMCMGCKFENATFRDADLYWLIAFRASFRNAVMDGCAFRRADLKEVDFSGASLRNAKFLLDNLGGRTDLSGADLSTAVIDGADFSGASYDAATKFPTGFDPAAHGLLKVPSDN